jgi:hypothetical protein
LHIWTKSSVSDDAIVEEAIMPNDSDLTDRLSALLLETAEAFLRLAQEQHHGRTSGAEYEISLAVRQRTIPLQ